MSHHTLHTNTEGINLHRQLSCVWSISPVDRGARTNQYHNVFGSSGSQNDSKYLVSVKIQQPFLGRLHSKSVNSRYLAPEQVIIPEVQSLLTWCIRGNEHNGTASPSIWEVPNSNLNRGTFRSTFLVAFVTSSPLFGTHNSQRLYHLSLHAV